MQMSRRPRSRRSAFRRGRTRVVAWALVLAAAAIAAGGAVAEESSSTSPVLRLSGMTFVGSRGDVSEFVVRAEEGLFVPETRIAHQMVAFDW